MDHSRSRVAFLESVDEWPVVSRWPTLSRVYVFARVHMHSSCVGLRLPVRAFIQSCLADGW